MLYCSKCAHMICMNMCTTGICKLCGKEIFCGHSPTHEICDACSKKENRCIQCGEKLKKDQ